MGPLVKHRNFKFCDISNLENDTEMVDHSINPEFAGAYNELCYILIKDHYGTLPRSGDAKRCLIEIRKVCARFWK